MDEELDQVEHLNTAYLPSLHPDFKRTIFPNPTLIYTKISSDMVLYNVPAVYGVEEQVLPSYLPYLRMPPYLSLISSHLMGAKVNR